MSYRVGFSLFLAIYLLEPVIWYQRCSWLTPWREWPYLRSVNTHGSKVDLLLSAVNCSSAIYNVMVLRERDQLHVAFFIVILFINLSGKDYTRPFGSIFFTYLYGNNSILSKYLLSQIILHVFFFFDKPKKPSLLQYPFSLG